MIYFCALVENKNRRSWTKPENCFQVLQEGELYVFCAVEGSCLNSRDTSKGLRRSQRGLTLTPAGCSPHTLCSIHVQILGNVQYQFEFIQKELIGVRSHIDTWLTNSWNKPMWESSLITKAKHMIALKKKNYELVY